MMKKGRKKLKIAESDSDTEVVEVPPAIKTKVMYEDTRAITGADLELMWGQIYPMLVERKVLEVGLGDLALYKNILRSGLTKIETRADIFPCAEVIGWMFPKIDTVGMMINDEEGNLIASFTPAFISAAYSLPEKEIRVTTKWVKSLKFDYTTTAKMMVAEGKTFRHKQSREYETAHLRTPFRIIALMMRKLYSRVDGKM